MQPPSVENVCNLLAKSRLLTPDQVRDLFQRWRDAARAATDADAFSQWLVSSGYVTEYQAGLVMRGKVDHFFFGPYKILERIGKGRMAGVYKAIHMLGQSVAIKVLPPSRAKDPQMLARFQREARIAMRLKHANVVRTYQAGQTDGLYYIVMEYLEGETLEEVLKRRGKLPPPEAVRIVYQALLGLQHIHEQGMIHRDIKPGNLMLLGGTTSTTERATVKVMDIGLGKALFDETTTAPEDHDLTAEGSLLGTPDYMAPEQARNVQMADIRADIYSIGCTLYQTLSGQVPFPDTNLVRQLMRHASEAPRPLTQLNPAVAAGLQQIVEWMMAKDPAQRYPTPQRAAQALQVFLAAGADAPAQYEPKMRVFLDWLDSQSGEVAVAEPVNDSAKTRENTIELVPVAAARVEPEPASDRKKRKREPGPEPMAPKQDHSSRTTAARKRKRQERDDEDDEESESPRGLNRRDWLMIAMGGVALGVAVGLVVALVYGLTRWLRPKRETEPEDAPSPSASQDESSR